MSVTPVGFMLDKSLNLSSKYLKKMGVKNSIENKLALPFPHWGDMYYL